MTTSVQELTKRFLRALDSNYNVVDEKSVYDIISTLENTRVTRELLEATRLAKHINELRRKTQDQVLARRSKSLLKRWREMLLPAVSNSNTNSNSSSSSVPAAAATNRTAVGQQFNQSIVPQQQQTPGRATTTTNQNGALISTPRGPGRPPKQPPPLPLHNQQQLQQQQQSSLSSLHNNNSSSKLTGANFSQHLQQQNYGKHKENHMNNNSLRVPMANFPSTSLTGGGIRPLNSNSTLPTSEPEIINLTDDRSNSPSMFQQYQQRLQQQQVHRSSPSKRGRPPTVSKDSGGNMDYLSASTTTISSSANNYPAAAAVANNKILISQQNSMSGKNTTNNNIEHPPLNNSRSGLLTSCDNNIDYENSNNVLSTNATTNLMASNNNSNTSTTSRKHKKHKKEKRVPEILLTPSKSNSAYNHHHHHLHHNNAIFMDDHSAPQLLRDRNDDSSLQQQFQRHGTSNSLILPDNDSLSNTSASIFNSFGTSSTAATTTGTNNATYTPTGTLSFAGHFSKANSGDNNTLTDDISTTTLATSVLPSIPPVVAPIISSSNNSCNNQLKLNNNLPQSRSVSPNSLMSHHSNHSVGSAHGGGGGLVNNTIIDPDVIIVNHSQDVPQPASTISAQESNQQQQQQPLVTDNVVNNNKMPKKRGRKKGSKGIDSLLVTQNEGTIQSIFNSDSFSDLKQKITSISGHKKVKTTKEILSDIQNKRSASGSTVTSPSVTQAPSPESVMSEISHHSQPSTRAASPEPSTSSAPHLLPVIEEEKLSTTTPSNITNKSTITEDVELQIKRLLAQLPPINKHEEEEIDSDDDAQDLIPKCTCTLREVTENGETTTTNSTDENQVESSSSQNPLNIEINIIKDSDEEMADAKALKSRTVQQKKRKREKVVKSIFDLDDDEVGTEEIGEMSDSDDDLESIPDDTTNSKDVIAVLTAGESLSQQSTIKTQMQEPTSSTINNNNEALEQPNANGSDEALLQPQFTKYEAVIDPDCPAMRFFETDRNEVTNYHIEALHNKYVPNVNGNWNLKEDAQLSSCVKDETDCVSIDTANHVVPRYNFLVCDKIPKQFSNFHFDYSVYALKLRERAQLRRIKAKMKKESSIKVEGDQDEEILENGNVSDVENSDVEMQDVNEGDNIKSTDLIHSSEDEDEPMEQEDILENPLPDTNNYKLPTFNNLTTENETGKQPDTNLEFSEWYQSVQTVSNGEDLIILPYVVID